MAVRNWKRLKQSQVVDCGAELPARVILEHDEEDHSCPTFVETFTKDGKPGFKAARCCYWEQEALADYNERMGK